MAIASNTFITYDAVGNREDLTDMIHNIAPVETWFTSNSGNVDGLSRRHEWQTDTLAAAAAVNRVEGDEFSATAAVATSRLANSMQIIAVDYIVSDTQDVVDKGGRGSETGYQTSKRTRELARHIEYALVINAAEVTGASATAREMNGLVGWITTNVTTGSATGVALIESLVTTNLGLIWAQGGFPKNALVSSDDKQAFDGFTGNGTRFLPMTKPEIETAVDVYRSSYGIISVRLHHIVNASAASRTLILGEMNLWRKAWLRRPRSREFPRTGDARRMQVIAELTLESGNEAGSGQVNTT